MKTSLMGHLEALAQWIALRPFRRDRADFYEDLGGMYARGESMRAFLEGEVANAMLTAQPARARALRILLQRYDTGGNRGLADLLRGLVPDSDGLMLAGVERAPQRVDALRALAHAVRLQGSMRKVLVKYSVMPVVIGVMCALMIKINTRLLVSIDQSTPEFARDLVWTGFNALAKVLTDFCYHWGGVSLLVITGAAVWIIRSLPRWTGRRRLRVDSWPVYSLYRDFQAGIALSALAMLLQAQGTLRGSLEDMARRSSPWMRWQLRRVMQSLDEAPNATVRAFSRGLLSPLILARLATLQRSAVQFSDVLIQLGTVEGDRVLARVERTAVAMNVVVVAVLVTAAAVLNLAAMTVPAAFANAMEPANLMTARQTYEQQRKSKPKPLVSQTAVR